jgi:hypothetical protein
VDEAKPFKIPKREVWEAYKRVKANQGSAGVDGQSIAEFEADLEDNLYKLWNRLSSGSYFSPPVRRVEIPKRDGGVRPLGIPTVADRVAQEVARRFLEPILDPVYSAFNSVLEHLRVGGVAWLGNVYWARFCVILVNVWVGSPFFMIMYLAALKSVPEQVHEAAAIDGANWLQKIWYINLPMMRTHRRPND